MPLDMQFLKKKAGPLTYGEWILIGSAGIAAAYWIRSRRSGTSASNVANAYDPLGNSAVSPAGGVVTGPTTGGGAASSQYTTNGEWGNAAVDALVKAGVAPATATQAIADYLAGNPLSSSEQALVGQAIGLIGNPPGGPIALITSGTGTSGSDTGGTYGGGYVDTGGSTVGSGAGDVGGSPYQPVGPAIGGTYTVKAGDNWINVAQRAGVSEEALLAVNASRGPSAMRIGETIYLPAGSSIPTSSGGGTTSGGGGGQSIVGYYTVRSGDNWLTVASAAGVSESALLSANAGRGPSALRIGESLAIPSPGHIPATRSSTSTPSKPSYYTVRSGDNWITVANQFGISEQTLLNLNASRGPSALRIGESLRVS